ncbi:MAG: redoxin domain-containing protein, partial [Deltaproteobacteria bacterium]|nr:redoxin domain-containing protein [Deltaproteobacteria bacterium]
LGEIFGFSSPRSLADLQQQTEDLEALGSRLETYADRWEATLEALRSENWRRFQAAHPGWGERLTPTALGPLDWPSRRALAVELLDALAPFTESHSAESHSEGQARFAALRWRADEARALHFRNDVRLGVVLRMRGVLVRIAGLHYLEDPAREAERGSFAALSACEDLPLGNGNPAAEAEEVASPAHFPSLQQEQQRMEAVSPAWLGINYQPVRRNESNASLPRGAVTVLDVYPDSPAERAGLEAADVIVGTPAGSFVEAHAIREWVMRREVGQAAELELLRAAVPRTVTILPSAYPLTLPELHARPSPGSLAPKLLARRLDGGELPASGGSRLLFFWASWCPVCERALPEVLALSGARDLEIVAVSDEDPTHLQAFLDGRSAPFPALVAADQERGDFRSYGVSGTPTIVIVDAEGRIEHYQTGYASGRGIEVPGWTWKPAPQESK